MALIKPFRAVRYDERRAGPLETLVAPPYDVIGPAERERFLAASPYNVVRLTLPDSEQRAADDFAAWLRDGVLVREEEPAAWWLVQDYVGPDGVARTREGLLASLRAEPYETGAVRPHERTHAGPKEGRLRLLRAVRAHLEPIFLLYDGTLPSPAQGPPDLEASEGGVTSCLWRLAARRVPDLGDAPLVIADGHHRYETALTFHAEDGSPESAFLMAVIVPTAQEGLTIFPTHRIVQRLPGDVDGPVAAGGPLAALARLGAASPELPAAVLYRGGRATVLVGDEQGLDAAFVESFHPEGVTYTPRAEEAIAAVDSGEAEAAFLLRPPTVELVEAVAARGEVMPQKSTYFYPKLHSGLLFHPL